MARKVIRNETGQNEAACQELIQKSIIRHDHIIEYLAIFIDDQRQYHFIYPLADTDLDKFISWESDSYNQFLHPKLFTQILDKVSNLAHALNHLHTTMRDAVEKDQILLHMDFRPANIFVKFADTDYKFLIGDVGLSRFKRAVTSNDNLKNGSKTLGLRSTGTYQAPEMHFNVWVGRKADVWSLGCILITVFTRVLAGEMRLKEFHHSLSETDSGYFYCLSGDKLSLNPAVEKWFEDFSSNEGIFVANLVIGLDSEGEFGNRREITRTLECLVSALRKALALKEEDRITAAELMKHLDLASKRLKNLLTIN